MGSHKNATHLGTSQFPSTAGETTLLRMKRHLSGVLFLSVFPRARTSALEPLRLVIITPFFFMHSVKNTQTLSFEFS